MIALYYNLAEEPVTDAEHHYLQIEQQYILAGDDATYVFRFNGRRVAPGKTTSMMLKLSGDTPADGDTLGAEVIDRATGTALSSRFSRDDEYFKVLSVELPQPVEENGEFDIQLSFRWPGGFPRARRHDYVFSTWGYYANQGVDRLTFKMISDVDIVGATLEELDEGKRRRARIQPKIIPQAGGRCEVSWSLPSPDAVLLMRFEKART